MQKLVLHGEIDVNSYVVDKDGKCFIIDPGFQKERLIKFVEDRNLEVMGILLTHGHFDHIGAVDAFCAPVYLHEKEMEIIMDEQKNGYAVYGIKMPFDLSKIELVPLKDGDKLKLSDMDIDVIHTPGHTVGGVCYKMENNLYSGDTLFEKSIGRYDFPTGDIHALEKSVVYLIENLDEGTRVHPGHGDSTTIGAEKMANPYYRIWKR